MAQPLDHIANDGERQVAPTVEGIRPDHVGRYMLATAMLRPGLRVLDAACGVGYGSALIHDKARCVVDGIDRSHDAIGFARAYYRRSGVRYRVADIAALPFADASFDAAAVLETIEHVEDAEAALREIARVLKPGSVLSLSTPNEEVLRWTPAFRHHVRHFTPAQTTALLEGAGFTPVHVYSNVSNGSDQFVAGWGGPFNFVVALKA